MYQTPPPTPSTSRTATSVTRTPLRCAWSCGAPARAVPDTGEASPARWRGSIRARSGAPSAGSGTRDYCSEAGRSPHRPCTPSARASGGTASSCGVVEAGNWPCGSERAVPPRRADASRGHGRWPPLRVTAPLRGLQLAVYGLSSSSHDFSNFSTPSFSRVMKMSGGRCRPCQGVQHLLCFPRRAGHLSPRAYFSWQPRRVSPPASC